MPCTSASPRAGKARHIFLTEEGVSFFTPDAGRGNDELMFTTQTARRGARPRAPAHQACRNARLEALNFHILRHTYGAQAVMAGITLQVLAQNLGHVTTLMTEKHYAHLTNNFVRDSIRQFVPSFGIKPDESKRNVTAL